MSDPQPLLTTGQAARVLGLSTKRVYQLIDQGRIEPAERTPLGMLFSRADIERLADERAAAKAAESA